MVKSSDVTLAERARKLCAQLGVPESAIKQARAGSVATSEGREYLIVIGELPDGRSVRMLCSYANPNYVVTFRPLP